MFSFYLEEDVAKVCYGYLRCPAELLPQYEVLVREVLKSKKIPVTPIEYREDGTPMGHHQHERGVYAAIKWGIANKRQWNEGLKSIKLSPPKVNGL
jgi:hypothetical protein